MVNGKENPFIRSSLKASSTTTPSFSGWTEKKHHIPPAWSRCQLWTSAPSTRLMRTHTHTHTLTLCFPSLSLLKAAFWIHLSMTKSRGQGSGFKPTEKEFTCQGTLYQLILSPRAPSHIRHCHSFILYYSSMTQWYACPYPSPPGRRRALWSLYGARGGSGAVTIRSSYYLSLPKRCRSFSQPLSTRGECLSCRRVDFHFPFFIAPVLSWLRWSLLLARSLFLP